MRVMYLYMHIWSTVGLKRIKIEGIQKVGRSKLKFDVSRYKGIWFIIL